MTILTEICAGFSMEPDGSPYVPGAFAWVMHEQLGRQTERLPTAGVRVSRLPMVWSGSRARIQWPYCAVLSVTGWDHSRMIGGLAYNLSSTALCSSHRMAMQASRP